jgi:hypothetical protein
MNSRDSRKGVVFQILGLGDGLTIPNRKKKLLNEILQTASGLGECCPYILVYLTTVIHLQ